MAGIMLRSLSNPRTPLPFMGESLSSVMGCPAWSHPGLDERTPISGGGSGKTKHAPESHRASPYPPLSRSSSGYGSAAGLKRLAAVSAARTSQTQHAPLRRTASLQGGDSLAALQAAADDVSCRPAASLHKPRRTRTGSRPLRPTQTLVNLDVLVCPPPAPPPRCDVRLEFPTPAPNLPPRRLTYVSVLPPKPQPRRRSSLAPEMTAPTAVVIRNGSVALPSPPVNVMGKKKRESLAQRTLRRTFERTPRGAQVKVLGAHAAVRMMTAMNENENEEDEAAVAASVVVVDEDECMTDSWVELDGAPISPVSPVLVEAPLSSHVPVQAEDMEWSMIDEDECRAA